MLDNKIFADLDLSFVPNPHSGDLMSKINHEAIKRSLRHAFQLNQFDIPFNSSIKSNLKGYLFEQNNHITRSAIEADLSWIAAKVEPRVDISNIDIEYQGDSTILITVTYKIKSTNQVDSFNLTVERIR